MTAGWWRFSETTARARGWDPRGSCQHGLPFYAVGMKTGGTYTVSLTDEELEIARHGMTAYLHSFGHDEADTVVLIRAVLARLAAARSEPASPSLAG